MEIWPTISRTKLENCRNGAIVYVAQANPPTRLAIVSMVKDGAKGLIYLADGEAKFRHVDNPESVTVFRCDEDPVLLLDPANSFVSSNEEIRTNMGLVVFLQSGWYLNMHQDNNHVKIFLQYSLEHKTVDDAYKSTGNEGMAFKNWKLALPNSHTPNAKPKTIFAMKL